MGGSDLPALGLAGTARSPGGCCTPARSGAAGERPWEGGGCCDTGVALSVVPEVRAPVLPSAAQVHL